MRRFSIRDLLWLTVVVALAVGWALERYQSPTRRLMMRAAAMHDALEAEGFVVEQTDDSVKIRRPGQQPPAYELGRILPVSFGIPNDFSGQLTESMKKQASAALGGAWYVESLRQIDPQEFARLQQSKDLLAEETVVDRKYVAFRDYRCVGFPGGVTGQMVVVERYLVVDP